MQQAYLHGTRIPHPHYSDSTNRFYDPGPSRPILQEPPPAHHRSGSIGHYPSVVVGQQPQATLTHLPPQQQQTTHPSIADLEREQRERAKERERNSIPSKIFF